MGLLRTVEPASLAVSLDSAKKQCELPDSDSSHDGHITRLIKAATSDVERHTRRALVTQTWRMSLSCFPSTRIYLPRPPLASVTSIAYVDDNGTTQTLSGSLYQVATDTKPGFVEPAYGESWPVTRSETVEAVQITYVAGKAVADVAVELQNAVYELVAFRFMNRGDVDSAIPRHIKWALESLKCGAKYDYFGIKN